MFATVRYPFSQPQVVVGPATFYTLLSQGGTVDTTISTLTGSGRVLAVRRRSVVPAGDGGGVVTAARRRIVRPVDQ